MCNNKWLLRNNIKKSQNKEVEVIKQISDIQKKRQTNIKRDKDKQYSTWAKKKQKIKDEQTESVDKLRCLGRVSSSCFTSLYVLLRVMIRVVYMVNGTETDYY